MGNAFLIAIVGGSGAGKSWLAARLQQALGRPAGHLSLDDFYRDLSHLPPAERDRVNFDHPEAVDWEAVREAVDAMSQGRTVWLPRYDFATHTRRAERIPWTPASLVILEGLWLLHPPWLRDRFSFSIYVECAAEERLVRRCARDIQERGRSRDSVERQFHDQVAPMHERFVLPQKQWATTCVSSPLPEDQLASLVRDIMTRTADQSRSP